ncbi:DinB family protein [Streptomyces sp. JUS-F4]|uniref:mycothiol transferase n=1 Tax=Streptomyces TaxID=1883 RepID=UPI002666CAE4|nr:DUF664 domain-containing protein [Streptomyces sp. JUS-F4]WKN18839.1 DinB family protein [Streptomyces sp. JUS-F4]
MHVADIIRTNPATPCNRRSGEFEQAVSPPDPLHGGLVKHLTAAELYWFHWAFEGVDFEHPDFGMDLSEGDSADSLLAAYGSAIERSNEIIERCSDLSHPCARAAGKAGAVRWVLVHMIEETARHAGHADILREQTDGSIGR